MRAWDGVVCFGCGMRYYPGDWATWGGYLQLCEDCMQRRLDELDRENRDRFREPIADPFEAAMDYWQDIGGEAGGA